MGVNILLVDDHAIVRVGFRALLEQQRWCGDITEAANGELGYLMFRDAKPHVVVMDLSMPKMSGVTAIQRIRSLDAAARILAVSVHDEGVFVMQAMKAGAAGYVSKASAPEELVGAVRAVEFAEARHAVGDRAPPTTTDLKASRLVAIGDSRRSGAVPPDTTPRRGIARRCEYAPGPARRVVVDLEVRHVDGLREGRRRRRRHGRLPSRRR
jgi:DNA-binding NarL/FixJ family response regulator